jgi:energy-converting hydrogenase Eha subunit H
VPEKLISFVQFGQIGFYFHKILANYNFVVFIIVILFSMIKSQKQTEYKLISLAQQRKSQIGVTV